MAKVNINKRKKMLHDVSKKLTAAGERNQCECTHTRKGEPDLRRSDKRTRQGELLFVCRQCEKDLRLNRVPEHTTVLSESGQEIKNARVTVGYREAVDSLDSMCDVIKMSLNTDKDKDAQMAQMIAEFQYRLRRSIVPMYQGSLTKTNKNEGRQRRDDGAWGRAEVR